VKEALATVALRFNCVWIADVTPSRYENSVSDTEPRVSDETEAVLVDIATPAIVPPVIATAAGL
jgi:hypothetical protein